MIAIFRCFVIALLLDIVWIYLSKQDFHSLDIENVKRRYSREANTPMTIIKEKLFERKTATKQRAKIIKKSGKLKTKVECAGLCLATKDCYAFHWEESEFTCTLMAEEGMCFDGKESTSIVVYADQAKNLPRCPVDCAWGEWKIGVCSKTCGSGRRTNTRERKVEAAHGGEECSGASTSTESCNVEECQVYKRTMGFHCGGDDIVEWDDGSSSNYGMLTGIANCKRMCNTHVECAGFILTVHGICGNWQRGPLNPHHTTYHDCYQKLKD